MPLSDNAIANNKSNSPWLSVILPVYNGEKYISKCLDTILGQTFADFEAIVVDDGSTDKTPDICREYTTKDKRIRYLRKENGGSFKARIYGAEHANGAYFTFCDIDDFYTTKNAFKIMYDELKDGKFSVLQFGYVKKHKHLKHRNSTPKYPIEVNKEAFTENEYPTLLCSHWKNSHLKISLCLKVYKRELLSKLPDSSKCERIFWGDDLITNLHLLENCDSIKYIPNDLYCYIQTSGNTKRFSTRTMKDLDKIKEYQLKFLSRYTGNHKEEIVRELFAEVAAWFFIFIQGAIGVITDEELSQLIAETLELPSFVLAREYFLTKNSEKWEAVDLLRKADINEYITAAKRHKTSVPLKQKVKAFLKRIYVSI